MSCNDSLKKAYQHWYLARQDGKPRASSYQVYAWAQEWYNGWDSADVYIKSGKGITCNRADCEGGYAYHAGKPNVAPAHWSTKLRKAKAQKALEALAESLGGMDALKALMGELTPAQAAVEAPPAAE